VGFVFSSQGRVDVADLVVLDDDRSLQVAQYLLPVGRADRLGDIERNTLDAVSSSLTTAELRAMNREIEAGSSMQTVVDRWLIDNGFDSAFPPATGALTIGSVDFAEVELVSRIYGGALGFKGKQVTVRAGLGSRALVAPLLSTGEIDLMVEYSGAYLTLLGGTPTADVTAAMADLRARLVPLGLWAGDPSLAQDTDAIAVPRAVAERYGLAEVSDLAFVPEPLVLVGPPDCPTRPTCLPGLRERYGIVIDG
jgi:osmoprotectant transport system substrate-binding protein